jgi:hypothetical protein
MTAELKVYRRSELELIADGCLFRYNKLWREMLDDYSDLSLIGIGGHAVKFAYIQRLRHAQVPQDAEEAQRAFVEGVANARTPARLIPEIKKVWDFHAERFELALDRFVAAEEKQVHKHVGFTPDLVYAHPERNELEILDDKWGWNPPLTEEALKMLFQARVYSRYGMERWPGFSSYRFTLNAVRFNKFVSVTFDRDELDRVDIEVEAAVTTINHAAHEGKWPAVAGPACQYCELECPAVSQVGDLPKRLSQLEQARIVAEWLLADAAQTKAGKKALKAWVAGHGPLNVNGMVWDNRKSVKRSYPLIEVVRAIAKRADFGAFDDKPFTVSHSTLKPVFKQFPELEEALGGVLSEKDSWRFTAKRQGEVDQDDEDDFGAE